MTQSPVKNNTTGSKKKGAAYETIYQINEIKFELSTGKQYFRITTFDSDGNGRETLCERVKDLEKIRKIENLSGDWGVVFGRSEKYDYCIRRQKDSRGNLTGYYKIVEKEKTRLERGWLHNRRYVNPNDWIYYAARRRT